MLLPECRVVNPGILVGYGYLLDTGPFFLGGKIRIRSITDIPDPQLCLYVHLYSSFPDICEQTSGFGLTGWLYFSKVVLYGIVLCTVKQVLCTHTRVAAPILDVNKYLKGVKLSF